jgi:hypothetical protein
MGSLLVLGMLASLATNHSTPVELGTRASPSEERMSYLDNGEIRIGVNLDLGGAIT